MVKQKGQVKASQQADDHSSSVVISLQSKLASTSTAFKDVLEMRTQVHLYHISANQLMNHIRT